MVTWKKVCIIFITVSTSFLQTMITDNILLGGREDAENAAQLLEYGVTHVLNTAQQLPNYFPQHFVYFKVGLIGRYAHLTSIYFTIQPIILPSLNFIIEQTQRMRMWWR